MKLCCVSHLDMCVSRQAWASEVEPFLDPGEMLGRMYFLTNGLSQIFQCKRVIDSRLPASYCLASPPLAYLDFPREDMKGPPTPFVAQPANCGTQKWREIL